VSILGGLDAELITLQSELLDHTGHVTRGLPRAEADRLIRRINEVRSQLEWPPIDMTGRWSRR
jgi:hypothetical protein